MDSKYSTTIHVLPPSIHLQVPGRFEFEMDYYYYYIIQCANRNHHSLLKKNIFGNKT